MYLTSPEGEEFEGEVERVDREEMFLNVRSLTKRHAKLRFDVRFTVNKHFMRYVTQNYLILEERKYVD